MRMKSSLGYDSLESRACQQLRIDVNRHGVRSGKHAVRQPHASMNESRCKCVTGRINRNIPYC